MAFEKPTAVRIAFTSISQIMKKIHEMLVAHSAWTVNHQRATTDTGQPETGDGSWSFAATCTGGHQIWFRNTGSTGSPDTFVNDKFYCGVDRGAGITNSATLAGASDACPEQEIQYEAMQSTLDVMILMFDDEIILLFENSSSSTYYASVCLIGKVITPFNSALAATPYFIDGLGVYFTKTGMQTSTSSSYKEYFMYRGYTEATYARKCISGYSGSAAEWQTTQKATLAGNYPRWVAVCFQYPTQKVFSGAYMANPLIVFGGAGSPDNQATDCYGFLNHFFRARSSTTNSFAAKDQVSGAGNDLLCMKNSGTATTNGYVFIAFDGAVTP